MEPEAYLLKVTTPKGELRRGLYHTFDGADQAAKMYARGKEAWSTEVVELYAVPQRGTDHE